MTTNDKPETATTSKKPPFIAYQVREGKNDQAFWSKVGVAYPHKDGKGFNILLESVPLDGRITLRTASEKKE